MYALGKRATRKGSRVRISPLPPSKIMEHVAIMKKSWGLIGKIISGEKKIESRWYKSRRSPWGKIKQGDEVYFKDSGEPVSIKAKVAKVISFADLTPKK